MIAKNRYWGSVAFVNSNFIKNIKKFTDELNIHRYSGYFSLKFVEFRVGGSISILIQLSVAITISRSPLLIKRHFGLIIQTIEQSFSRVKWILWLFHELLHWTLEITLTVETSEECRPVLDQSGFMVLLSFGILIKAFSTLLDLR